MTPDIEDIAFLDRRAAKERAVVGERATEEELRGLLMPQICERLMKRCQDHAETIATLTRERDEARKVVDQAGDEICLLRNRETNLLIAIHHLENWFIENTDGHHHCPWCYGRGDDAHGEELGWDQIDHHPSVDGIPCPIGAALSTTTEEKP